MPQLLRDALQETFAHWKDALPSAWQPLVDEVELAPGDVDESLELDPWVPVFPTLDGQSRVLGAPRNSDTFRAFREVRPEDVRVVIVGQDPYPDVSKATGVSFEQGNLRDWLKDERLVSRSLRRMIQAAASVDTGDDRYSSSDGWRRFIRDLGDGSIDARLPGEFFDDSRAQGVLWLNTTLSISLFRGTGREDHQRGHWAFWKPMVDAVLHHLATRDEPTVFVLWGSWARDLRIKLAEWAAGSGTEGSIGFAEASHPAAPSNAFVRADPFGTVNQELERLGQDPIDWL